MDSKSRRLADVSPQLVRALTHGGLPPAQFRVSAIEFRTLWVTMRDGVRLATDLYLPPTRPSPSIVIRTPYDRAKDDRAFAAALLAFARRGYAVISQDCRGTGDSEPNVWDYYVYELEDGYDLVDWIGRQDWFDGFVGSCGGSYVGQTQWSMALHPAMSAIAPNVSGLGVASNTAHLYMFINAYARSVNKGEDAQSIPLTELERFLEKETHTGGYFNEPLHVTFPAHLLTRFPQLSALPPTQAQRWLWERYCAMSGSDRAAFVKKATGNAAVGIAEIEGLSSVFGPRIAHDRHSIPHADPAELCRLIHAPPLIRTGWYDWALNDALATWSLFRREAKPVLAARARLIITPYAHNTPGYHDGANYHRELSREQTLLNMTDLLLRWYAAVREGTIDTWPTVIYYLMAANEWRIASDWPPPEAKLISLYLGEGGTLVGQAPEASYPDRYIYDPHDPTPTVGGSIVSYLYPPGSVDVSEVQKRADVLVYTTAPLERDLDVVGPLRMVLYASSSARDTDFVARLSDVFPDGRAIQLQNGILRARYRHADGDPELLEPGQIYPLEIDMWATASRFKAGHRLRLDLSSADFPRFDRNSNRAGEAGEPIPARQTIYHDKQHPSHVLLSVLGEGGEFQ